MQARSTQAGAEKTMPILELEHNDADKAWCRSHCSQAVLTRGADWLDAGRATLTKNTLNRRHTQKKQPTNHIKGPIIVNHLSFEANSMGTSTTIALNLPSLINAVRWHLSHHHLLCLCDIPVEKGAMRSKRKKNRTVSGRCNSLLTASQ